jgi:hypothetical protein
MPRLRLSSFISLLINPFLRPTRRLTRKRIMDQQQQQQPQPHARSFADSQQWQPQFQQPMPGAQQPQQQFAQFPPEGTSMPMHIPTQPSPQLDAVYSQPGQVPNQAYDPLDPAHTLPGFVSQQQMPQAFPQTPQQAPYGMPINPHGAAGQYHDPTQQFQQQAAPAGSAWEQANVAEANNTAAQFPGFDQAVPPSAQAQQNQALRDEQLFHARQRIEALEEERERLEMQRALEISARDVPGHVEMEEQLQNDLYQAQMQSLEVWERELRQGIAGQGSVAHGGYRMPPPQDAAGGFGHVQFPPASASASGVNMGWNNPPPPPQTPTRGIPLDEAAQNLPAEDAKRQAAFARFQGGDGGGETRSEYIVHPAFTGIEASTVKGKGRMV